MVGTAPANPFRPAGRWGYAGSYPSVQPRTAGKASTGWARLGACWLGHTLPGTGHRVLVSHHTLCGRGHVEEGCVGAGVAGCVHHVGAVKALQGGLGAAGVTLRTLLCLVPGVREQALLIADGALHLQTAGGGS